MKKLVTILAVFLTFGLVSQAQTFITASVASSAGTTFESLEVGATKGKNRLAAVVETYNDGNNFTFNSDREFYGGLKYTRVIRVGDGFSFLPSAAAKVHLDRDYSVVVEPGAAIGFDVSRRVSLIGGVSTPIYEGSDFLKPVNFKAALGIQVNL